MFILLPPSETKAYGGTRPAVDLQSLLFPTLSVQRGLLAFVLSRLCADLPAARAALGVGPSKDPDIAANVVLSDAPAMPALHRYRGVLYEALNPAGMTRIESARAGRRLLITSALFGMLAADDRIPAYRLSAGSKLPNLTSIPAYWRSSLTPLLADLAGSVVDLRSGAYAAFGDVPLAITVAVVTANADGGRTVVSHFNKATKGRLARLLAVSRADIRGVTDVARVARRAGMIVERTGPLALQVVT